MHAFSIRGNIVFLAFLLLFATKEKGYIALEIGTAGINHFLYILIKFFYFRYNPVLVTAYYSI